MTTKFCVNCKHWTPPEGHKDEGARLRYAKCSQEVVVEWNSIEDMGLVEYLSTGVRQLPYCTGARSSQSPCGREGKLFEERDRDAGLLPGVEVTHE